MDLANLPMSKPNHLKAFSPKNFAFRMAVKSMLFIKVPGYNFTKGKGSLICPHRLNQPCSCALLIRSYMIR